METLLIESHYFPCIEYFSLLQRFSSIQIEINENFQKQTYRNRCEIIGSNKVVKLVVPVQKSDDMRMGNVKIDYSQNWQKDHWKSITSSYNRSPFFEHYKDELEGIIIRKHEKLVDLNGAVLTYCLDATDIKINRKYTDSYEKIPENGSTIDFRDKIIAKKSFSTRNVIKPVRYYQVFGKTFVPNMSIIDLLFCEGPMTGSIIERSVEGMNN